MIKLRMLLKNEFGFTLMESMFVTLIFPLVFFSLYSVMTMTNVIFNTNNAFSQLNQTGMQALRYISREIGQTSPNVSPNHLTLATDGSGNSIVDFQIPVDWDNDGDVVTGASNPATEWGAYDDAGVTQNGQLGFWVRYSVTDNQLVRTVLDAGKAPIAGMSRVVANNIRQDVPGFVVAQNQNTVTMTLQLRVTDAYSTKNGTSRNIDANMSSSTLLRNAVN